MNAAETIVAFLHRRAFFLIAGLVVVALGLGVMATKIKVDNSLRVWFIDGDPALDAYDAYKKEFGNDETIVIGVTDFDGIYTPEALERIRAASERLEAHPRVRRVTSVTLGLHVSGEEGVVEIERLLGEGPVTPEEAAAVRRRVESNPTFRATIASDNDTITLILVEPKSSDNFDAERGALIDDVTEIAKDTLVADDGEFYLGGIGVVYEGLNRASLRDSSVFVTLSYLMIFLGLWVMFRRWIWVLLGAGVITVANLATLGVAGLAGRDMNMVTAVLPTLIMTIGILDLVHLIEAYEDGRRRDPGLSRKKLLLASLGVVIVPCIFNTITDAVGFMALSSAKMSAIRDLGWLAAVGLGFLLLSVLIFAVPTIARFGGRKPMSAAGAEDGWMSKVVLSLFDIARYRRGLVFGGTVVLIAVAAYGITRVQVDTYTIGFLDEDNDVRRDHEAILSQFGNYVPMEFTVDAHVKDGLEQPATLRRVDEMERKFEAHPNVSRATGLVEVVKRVNQIWNDEKPEYYAIPDKQGIIAEELLMYRFNADGRDHLDDLVTPNDQRMHVTVRTGLPSARVIQATVNDLDRIGAETMGDTADVEPAGYLPLYVHIIQHITHAQITSFAIALLLVTLVLMLLLRSVKLGLIAMIPNMLPAAMTLGFMGIMGIRLDVATVLIAAIAIGISVNDTSHIMFRFRHELRKTPGDPEDAVRRMMLHAGRPVVASSLILMAGFLVLLAASVKSISYFGMLSAATIGSALVADLLITPALLLTLVKRR